MAREGCVQVVFNLLSLQDELYIVYTVGCFYPVTTVFNVFESIGGSQLIPSTPRLTLLI